MRWSERTAPHCLRFRGTPTRSSSGHTEGWPRWRNESCALHSPIMRLRPLPACVMWRKASGYGVLGAAMCMAWQRLLCQGRELCGEIYQKSRTTSKESGALNSRGSEGRSEEHLRPESSRPGEPWKESCKRFGFWPALTAFRLCCWRLGRVVVHLCRRRQRPLTQLCTRLQEIRLLP